MRSEGYSTWFVCVCVCLSVRCEVAETTQQGTQQGVPTASARYGERIIKYDFHKNASLKRYGLFTYRGNIDGLTSFFQQ